VPVLVTDRLLIGDFVGRIIKDERTLNQYVIVHEDEVTMEDVWKMVEQISPEGKQILAKRQPVSLSNTGLRVRSNPSSRSLFSKLCRSATRRWLRSRRTSRSRRPSVSGWSSMTGASATAEITRWRRQRRKEPSSPRTSIRTCARSLCTSTRERFMLPPKIFSSDQWLSA
jgi:hypothetical protein